jgi:hypothetical protein
VDKKGLGIKLAFVKVCGRNWKGDNFGLCSLVIFTVLSLWVFGEELA